MPKAIIADDHRLFADGLEEIIIRIPEMEVIAKATSGREVMQSLNSNNPDIILLDIQMPQLDGFETAVSIRKHNPGIKIVLISHLYNNAVGKFINEWSIDGFITKDLGAPDLLVALQKILSGEKFFLLPNLLTATHDLVRDTGSSILPFIITKSELQILKLLAKGNSTKMIADTLQVSILTIETHRKNMFRKLGAKNVAELVAIAIRKNLI